MGEVATLKPQQANVPALAMDQGELIQVMKSSLYPGASDESVALVLSYCRATGLDPMKKPVHIVPMWDKKLGRTRDVVMPGIGSYRTDAARSGQMAGISEPEFGPIMEQTIGGVQIKYPEWCRVTAKRRLATGEIANFTASERWLENYAEAGGQDRSIAPNRMWSKRPYGQLAKCAQAQALRMAFPETIGAQPTAEEMEGKAIEGTYEIVNDQPAAKQPASEQRVTEALPDYPDEKFQASLPVWRNAIENKGKRAAAVIATVKTKYTLLPEQIEQIKALEAAPQGETHENV